MDGELQLRGGSVIFQGQRKFSPVARPFLREEVFNTMLFKLCLIKVQAPSKKRVGIYFFCYKHLVSLFTKQPSKYGYVSFKNDKTKKKIGLTETTNTIKKTT
ncbi:hypothetical protein MC885_011678 [Smutsia gigantea]|nr:hypothetical protein MC885_011678 [Smutsia gigantea]